MARISLDLSDRLARLAEDFDQFAHGGIAMDGDTVLGIVAIFRTLHRAARELENEVSKKRWNEAALVDRLPETKLVLAEIERPGSNVALFPVIRRPFSDGQPHGAA